MYAHVYIYNLYITYGYNLYDLSMYICIYMLTCI